MPKPLLDREANIGQLHGSALSHHPSSNPLDRPVAETPRLTQLTGRRWPLTCTTSLQNRHCRLVWWV